MQNEIDVSVIPNMLKYAKMKTKLEINKQYNRVFCSEFFFAEDMYGLTS